MVNQGSLAPEVRQNAIEALKILGEYGKARKVLVTLENRDTGAAPPAPSPSPAACRLPPAAEAVAVVDRCRPATAIAITTRSSTTLPTRSGFQKRWGTRGCTKTILDELLRAI